MSIYKASCSTIWTGYTSAGRQW